MRGIFAAGVLDSFLQASFNPFDVYLGVSAGASTLSSFLAGQFGRHRAIYTRIACRPEFMSFRRMLRGGSYMDLDWLWNTVESHIPLCTTSIDRRLSGKECYIVCTRVQTGSSVYLSPKGREWIQTLKASSALPLLYKPFPHIGGHALIDGGISDPIPVREAYVRGARHIVVIRTRPAHKGKESGLEPFLGSLFFRRHPGLKQGILRHARRYNRALDFMTRPPEDLTLHQVAPDTPLKTRRTTRNPGHLIDDYNQGLACGHRLVRTLTAFNTSP